MVLRYKDIHTFINNKTMKIIYSMYRAGEVSVHRDAASGLPNLLVWRGRYYLSRVKISRCYHTLSENGNGVFTHSLDVNKNV